MDEKTNQNMIALKMRELELKIQKSEIELEIKKGNICTINSAKAAINSLVTLFISQLAALNEEITHIIPTITPNQFESFTDLLDSYRKVLGNTSVNLSIESLEAHRESLRDTERENKRKQRAKNKAKGV